MDVPEIDVNQLESALGGGAALFDVRELDEHSRARIPGARLIAMVTVPDRISEFPTDETAYVVCATGRRSGQVVEYLRARGVDAVNVAGGTSAWIESGKEYESDTGPV